MAKQLLNGQKIVVVRCEALNISGEFFRAKRMSDSLRLRPRRREANSFVIIVKYLAYLRKMTRYNPTRGGALYPSSQATCGLQDDILTWLPRALPLPRSFPYLLQDCPWYDTSQNCSRGRRNGTSEGLRRCPTTIRQEETYGCTTGAESTEVEAWEEVLHRWPIEPRGWVEVQGCG